MPAPPMKISAKAHAITEPPMKVRPDICENTLPSHEVSSPKSNVPVKNESSRMPIKKNRSAKRVTINAFFEAAIASGFV